MIKFAKKLTNKKILDIFTMCILIVIPILQILAFYLQNIGILNNYNSINSSMVLWFCIPIFIYVYIKDIVDKKRKIDIYDYILYFLILIGIIVTIFARFQDQSLFGSPERRGGLLTIVSYYLLFINWKVNGKEKDIKKYINVFIIIGIINSIYALLQIYTPFKFILRYAEDTKMASGIIGNPNFFGSLIVLLLGIIISKFLMDKKINKQELLLIILFLVSLFNCQSTGPMLSLFVFIIFELIFLKCKNKLVNRKIIILFLLIIFTFIGIYLLNLAISKKHKNTASNVRCELCDIKKEITTGGNGRLEIWKKTINIVKKNPIIGVGYDNLEFVYPNPKVYTYFYIVDGKLEIREQGGGFRVDNAHNIYLHDLAVSGILGLIPYLILCLYTFIHGLKSNNKFIIMILGGFVLYSIQAFFNISVIEVAPMYYIIIGLILSEKENKDKSLT